MDILGGDSSSNDTEDFYSLLHCDESSSSEQISTEFKLLAKIHHPDKVVNPDEKEAAERFFLRLKQARDVLLDAETRQKYDQWRTSFRRWISFDDWLKMQSRIHASIHWASSAQKMPRLEQPSETPGGERGSSCSSEGGRRGRGREGGGSEEGVGDVTAALHQFRRGSVGGTRASKFRNYQI